MKPSAWKGWTDGDNALDRKDLSCLSDDVLRNVIKERQAMRDTAACWLNAHDQQLKSAKEEFAKRLFINLVMRISGKQP
jgi:hypothetical protein